MMLAREQLIAATGCSQDAADIYGPHLNAACAAFGINTPARMAAFLAQIGHESGAFRYVREIADGSAYEGRKDLGNTEPGDGKRYRGRGLIQLTGRANAREMSGLLGPYGAPNFEQNPEELESPKWACFSAAAFWSSRGCSTLADAGNFEAITRRINGGLNGQEDRLARWERSKRALAVAAPTPAPTPAPAPAEPRSSKMPPFLIPALTAIMQVVPELAKKWGNSEPSAVATRNVAAVTSVVDVVKTALGASNEQDMVEKLASPEAVATAREAVQGIWWQIDASGVDAARKQDAVFTAPGGAKFWMSPAFYISILLMAFPAMLAVDVFYVHPEQYGTEIRTQIVTALLAVIMVVSGYWLGTSASSARKTELAASKE